MGLRILIIGSGGREHAMSWIISKSKREIEKIFVMPGNAGTLSEKNVFNIDYDINNHQSVLNKNWKYIVSKKENFHWLFNTSIDPTEKNNLIESHPKKAQLLKSLLDQFNSEQADPVIPSAYEVPILIDKYDGQKYEEGDDYIYWSN